MMKTSTFSISTAALLSFLGAFAMVPLPTIEGEPTGLRLTYNLLASPHIAGMSDWVIQLSNTGSDQRINETDVKAKQFEYYLHRSEKPKRYDYDDTGIYRDEMDEWRDKKKYMEEELKNLKMEGRTLESSRVQMIAQSPIKKLWQSE